MVWLNKQGSSLEGGVGTLVKGDAGIESRTEFLALRSAGRR